MNSTSGSTPGAAGSGRQNSRSGWRTTPTIGATTRMFTPLHQVCTGIPGNVQTRILAGVAVILLSERYVQIRMVIYTIYRERRVCVQERVTPTPGLCEIRSGANILTIREETLPIREQPATCSFSRCKPRCKGVQTGVTVQTNTPVNPESPGCSAQDHVAVPATVPSREMRRAPTTSRILLFEQTVSTTHDTGCHHR